MSYCVHCGVELAPSERDCPLCGTQVMNPSCAWEKPAQMPYPETVDIQKTRIDRRFARQLIAQMMLIPCLVAFLIDLVDGGGLKWSWYVIGALALSYCWIVVPLLFKLGKPYLYIVIDLLSLAAYLLLIAVLSGGGRWFWGLVLPLLLFVGAAIMASLWASRRLAWAPLHRAAVIFLMFGAFLMGLEIIISLYAGVRVAFRWSFYAAIPAAAVALMLWLLERNEGLKQEIRKRLFI